jgi:hypothetical protein
MTKTTEKTNPGAEELLAQGTTTLSATSREEIYKQADELLAALPLGTKWTRTIVEHDPWAGTFTQTYSILKD